MTGRYPNSHGVWNNGVPLPRATDLCTDPASTETAVRWYGHDVISHVPTLADVMAEAGYLTAAVGKLHFTPFMAPPACGYAETISRWSGAPSDDRLADWHGPYYGFEHVEFALGHGEFVSGHYQQWLQKEHPAVWRDLQLGEHRNRLPFPEFADLYPSVVPQEAHHTTWVADRSCAFLRQAAGANRPFFLFVGFPDPHDPFTPPADLAREFETHAVLPARLSDDELASKPEAMVRLMDCSGAFAEGSCISTRDLPADCVVRVRQYTDAMIHLIDRSVGRILAALVESELWEDTVVIFTSDHGDFLGDHGLMWKDTLCSDVLVHVPFILRAPRAGLPGETATPMSNVDVLPTICELTGVPVPAGVQGQSVLQAVHGGQPGSPLVMCYNTTPRFHNFSIYDERRRFTWYPATGERELYDHLADPHELTNLAGRMHVAAEEDRLFQRLLEQYLRLESPAAGRVALW